MAIFFFLPLYIHSVSEVQLASILLGWHRHTFDSHPLIIPAPWIVLPVTYLSRVVTCLDAHGVDVFSDDPHSLLFWLVC